MTKKCNTCAKFKELDQFKHYNLTNTCGYSKNCLLCIKAKTATTKAVTTRAKKKATKEDKLAKLEQAYHITKLRLMRE